MNNIQNLKLIIRIFEYLKMDRFTALVESHLISSDIELHFSPTRKNSIQRSTVALIKGSNQEIGTFLKHNKMLNAEMYNFEKLGRKSVIREVEKYHWIILLKKTNVHTKTLNEIIRSASQHPTRRTAQHSICIIFSFFKFTLLKIS